VLIVCAYANTLQNRFVRDDTQLILRNPDLSPGTPWSHYFTSDVWAFTHRGERSRNNYYRPLGIATYRLTTQLFGFDPRAFHAVSLLFHLSATLLAYAVLLQLTKRRVLGAAAAAIFAVHPIHTEAVAWVSALPELGCAVCFLLAFWVYLLAARPSTAGSAEHLHTWTLRPGLWVLSCASFAVALLWKEMALTLPIVIGAHIILCNPEPPSILARLRRALWVMLPYGAAVGAYLLLRYYALGFLYFSQRKWLLSPRDYVLTVVDLTAKYCWKLLLPLHLSAFHVFDPVRSLLEARVLAAILFLLVAASAIAYGLRRAPLVSFAATSVFLTLVPALNLRGVGRNVFGERYLYIPSLGFCLLVA